MIEIIDIHQSVRTGFWLKRVPILKGISFRVERGSTHGLLGANGAGKTTLIHLLVGIRRPESGTIRIDGLLPSAPAAKSRLGYLPERPLFQEYLTGRQILTYYARLSELAVDDLHGHIERTLERVGIRHAADLVVKGYSKGMLQRLGIAQAILHHPDLLVLDEPMSGLDPVGRKEMRDLIASLAREGKTILFSSHVIPDIEALCESVTVIERGSLIAHGKIDSILDAYSTKIEIRFKSDGAHTPSVYGLKAEIERVGDGYRLLLDDANQLQPTIQALFAAGARLESVSPIRPSLEEVFFK